MLIRKILSTSIVLAFVFLFTSSFASAREYQFQKAPGVTIDVLSEQEFLSQYGDDFDSPRTDAEVIELAEKLFPPLWKKALDIEALDERKEAEARCGTHELGLLFTALENPAISDSTRAQVDAIIDAAKPPLPRTYSKGHFIFHYTVNNSNPDHNVTKAEIVRAAKYLNKYWTKFSDKFKTPLYYKKGSRKVIGVNVYYIGSNILGWTSPVWKYIELNSKICIRSSCRTRTTGTHELFHRVQFSYGLWSDKRWIVEGTAKWLEIYMEPGILTYMGWLNYGLRNPDVALIKKRSYDAVHFWLYLKERSAWSAIRNVWQTYEKNGNDAKAATTTVIKKKLGMSFNRFAQLWIKTNYLKDLTSPGSKYDYAEDELVKTNCGITYGPFSSVPRTKTTIKKGTNWSRSRKVRSYGADYCQFKLDSSLEKVRVVITGGSGDFSYHFIGIKNDRWKGIKNTTKKKYTYTRTLDPGQWDKLVVVIGGRSKGGEYTIKASGP